jgi:hypothetical protein
MRVDRDGRKGERRVINRYNSRVERRIPRNEYEGGREFGSGATAEI